MAVHNEQSQKGLLFIIDSVEMDNEDIAVIVEEFEIGVCKLV